MGSGVGSQGSRSGREVECCGVAFDITVPSPHTVSTPHSSSKYDQGANHDHDNCKLKEGGEVHIRPDPRRKRKSPGHERPGL
jgi:hypothetical protein